MEFPLGVAGAQCDDQVTPDVGVDRDWTLGAAVAFARYARSPLRRRATACAAAHCVVSAVFVARQPPDLALIVEKLARMIGERLDGTGWQPQPVEGYGTLNFTLPTSGGVVATAELICLPVDRRKEWPVAINLFLGAGYQPAIDLMSLLGLPLELTMVPNPLTAGRDKQPVAELGGVGDIPAAAQTIYAIITRSAVPFAERFSDADTLLAARRSNSDLSDDNYEDALSLMLLASTGKRTQTKSLLDNFPPAGRRKSEYFDERRFVEQSYIMARQRLTLTS